MKLKYAAKHSMQDDGLSNPDKEYFDKKGRLHRRGGPASYNDNTALWFRNGRYHRLNGPAIEVNLLGKYDGIRIEWWYQNGMKHRTDGPAFTNFRTGKKENWYRGQRVKSNVDWEFYSGLDEIDMVAYILKYGNVT